MNDLITRARARARQAYAPYSKFRVGAVVVAADGRTFEGANVENGAFGSSMCAEATAIGTAVSEGARKIDTVVVACIDAEEGGYPCGNCLQLMAEFGVERVVVDTSDGPVDHTFDEMMPYAFRLDE